MKIPEEGSISRREFAKVAALTTAAAMIPLEIAGQQKPDAPKAEEKAPELAKLAPASQAEADLAYETVMRKYGERFNDEQKRDIKRLVYQQQSGLDKIRAFAVNNDVQPALVFIPYRGEGKR
jgi:hypothetical protein